MRFEILGPLCVRVRDREIQVTAGRDRVVLAMLILHANRAVPISDLVDAVWDENPPRNARGQVHGCVSRLRKRLADQSPSGQIIITEPEGYRLRTDPVSVDLLEFRALVSTARTAAADGEREMAREHYRAALALWRGSAALAGIDKGTVRQVAAGVEEEHTRALEDCIELELALGGAGELIGELAELTHQHPYRERLHAALMLALYRADRQADAFAAYQRIRRALANELGQEPGPALRDLHQRILTGDRTLRPRDLGRRSETDRPLPARRHLPRTLNDFTGRQEDLSWLTKLASQPDPYAPVVVTIDGMPGVGKTSLAIRAAHVLESQFPDGQLFIDLHGHSKQRPVEPAAALGSLLRQLGVPSAQIAPGFDERIAQWRSELADRKAIVVLDNAASTAQVSPLLPASAGWLGLVTSRRRLVDLDGAHPLSIGTLGPDEAVALLERVAGHRVAVERAAAAEVAKRCGYLPLALRLAAARLAHRPRWHVQDLADRLANAHPPSAELVGTARTVTDAFALSYRDLTPPAQRMFRFLGLHPGEQFDTLAAAALTSHRLDDAQRLVDELVDAHLVEEPLANRYRLHDLLRSYASNLAQTLDSESDREQAVQQLLDYYLHGAVSALSQLISWGGRQDFEPDRPPMRPDLVKVHRGHGKEWLEVERPTLVSAVRCAAAYGLHRYTWLLARVCWRFLYMRGYLDELVHTHRLGLTAAEHLKDEAAAATMHNYLASAYFLYGQSDEAADHVRQALAHHLRTGDLVGQTTARRNLASVLAYGGRPREATDECQLALATAARSGDPSTVARTVVAAGGVLLSLGQYHAALAHSRHALALSRELGNEYWLGTALANVGISRARLGQSGLALLLLRAALRVRRRAHDRWGEAETLNELGAVCRALRRLDEAISYQQQALTIADEAGFRQEKCAIYNELGRTLLARGETDAALAMLQRALAETVRIRHKYGQARALDGIAACLRGTDPESARRHWLRALRLYEELDVPERHDVKRHLAMVS